MVTLAARIQASDIESGPCALEWLEVLEISVIIFLNVLARAIATSCRTLGLTFWATLRT